jgi:hypothetical protein
LSPKFFQRFSSCYKSRRTATCAQVSSSSWQLFVPLQTDFSCSCRQMFRINERKKNLFQVNGPSLSQVSSCPLTAYSKDIQIRPTNRSYSPNTPNLIISSPVITTCTTSFSTLKRCILPAQCICVFHMVLTIINSDCFLKQR